MIDAFYPLIGVKIVLTMNKIPAPKGVAAPASLDAALGVFIQLCRFAKGDLLVQVVWNYNVKSQKTRRNLIFFLTALLTMIAMKTVCILTEKSGIPITNGKS